MLRKVIGILLTISMFLSISGSFAYAETFSNNETTKAVSNVNTEKTYDRLKEKDPIVSILENRIKFSDATKDEANKLCSYFKVEADVLKECEEKGYQLFDSIDLGIISRKFKCSIEDAATLISKFNDAQNVYTQIDKYITLKESQRLTEAQDNEVRKLMLEGNSVDNIEAKLLNSGASNIVATTGSSTKVNALTSTSSSTTEKSFYNMYFNAPFDINKNGDHYVNPSDGSFVYDHSDLKLPGRNGLDLDIKLNYNSGAAGLYLEDSTGSTHEDNCVNVARIYNYDGSRYGIGEGWSLSFSSIETIKSNKKYLHLYDGREYDIRNTSQLFFGGYDMPYGLNDVVLSTDYNGTFSNGEKTSSYIVTYKDGRKEYFADDGRLIGIQDRYKNTITFNHIMINNYALISKITDTLGRVITINYNDTDNGRETIINVPGNKTIKYVSEKIPGYSNKYILKSETDLDGNTTTFEYQYNNVMYNYFSPLYYPSAGNVYADVTKINYTTGCSIQNSYNKVKISHMSGAGSSQDPFVELSSVVTTGILDKGVTYNQVNYNYSYNSYNQNFFTTVDDGKKSTRYCFAESFPNVGNKISEFTTYYNSNGKVFNKEKTYEYFNYALPSKIVEMNSIVDGATSTKTIQYSYDVYGDILSYIDELGNKFTYTYDSTYHLKTSESSSNNTITYGIDSATGNVNWKKKSYISYPVDCSILTDYTYDTYGNLLSEILHNSDGSTIVTNYEYSPSYNYGYLTRKYNTVKDYNGVSQTVEEKYSYDFNTGNKLNYTDANNNTTAYEYDNLGRTIKVTNPDFTYFTLSYDDVQNITTLTDENGHKIQNIYDGLGRLTKKQELNNGSWITLNENYYNSYGEIDWTKDGNGNITYYQYDPMNRLITTTNPDKTTITISYDDIANTKTSVNEEWNPHYYYYDLKGQLTKEVTVPDKNNSSVQKVLDYSYDNMGNLAYKGYEYGTSFVGTSYNRDFSYRITQAYINNNSNNEIIYTYNNQDKITKIVSPGKSTTYKYYDELGREIKEVDPLNKTEYTSYDGVGNIIKQIDSKGQITIFQYDNRNRLLNKTSGSTNISYTYDNVGNVLTVKDGSGTTTNEYYENGKIKRITQPDGRSIYYEYDNNGNRTKLVDQFGKTTTYQYDSRNRLAAVVIDGGTTTYSYYPDGSRQSITYPNGVREEYSYNSDNKVTNVTNKKADGTIISKFDYTYDTLGNQLSKTDKNGTTYYTYDNELRISTVTEPDGTKTTYIYDLNNNTVSKTSTTSSGATKQTISYDYDADDRMTGNGEIDSDGTNISESFTYDDNGNLSSVSKITTLNGVWKATENTQYQYNQLNQLTEYIGKDGTKTDYSYDSNGLRTSKTSAGNTTGYYYDGNNVVIETVNGNLSARNIWGINPIARQDNQNNILYYLYNGHADVMSLVDVSGNVTNSYDYDVYGNIKQNTENSLKNPIKYAEQYYDDENSMYYLRARYYDPNLMRFITEDTNKGKIEDPLSLNLYTYCEGNPIQYYDSDGHDLKDVWNDITEVVLGGAVYMESKAIETKEELSEAAEKFKDFIGIGEGAPEAVDIDKIIETATKDNKGGETVVGHALQKHASTAPDVWGKIKGNAAQINANALNQLNEIMNGAGNFKVVTTDKGIKFLEKYLSDGRGVRLNMDGTFKGFVDLVRVRK